MKRITILTILCLLLAGPGFTHAQQLYYGYSGLTGDSTVLKVPSLGQLAWMNPSVLGGGGGAVALSCDACSSSTDTRFDASATTPDGAHNSAAYFAWQFSVAATKCVTGTTLTLTDGGNSYGAVSEIWTDSGGSPGSRVGDGYTATISNLPNSVTDNEFIFSSCQTLDAGTYWVIGHSVSAAQITWSHAASCSGALKYSSDSGSTWNTYTTNCLIFGVLGCDQS